MIIQRKLADIDVEAEVVVPKKYTKKEVENIAKEAYKIRIRGLSILDFEKFFNEKTNKI